MNRESMCFQTGGQSTYNGARASPAGCSFHTCLLRSNLWLATWTKRDMGTEGEQPRTPKQPCPPLGDREEVAKTVNRWPFPLAFFLWKPIWNFSSLHFLHFLLHS